jgi:[ribosomal protein S5]-alanine N-acetyltransferase
MLRLDGERIYLRDFEIDDLAEFHRLISDPDLMRYSNHRTDSPEESLDMLKDSIAESEKGEKRAKFFFAFVRKDPEYFIGGGGFTILEKNATGGIAGLGYFLYSEFWSHGYATEASMLMIDYGFTDLGLHRIRAGCDKVNPASERVMVKSGMQKEAELRQKKFNGQEWVDRLEYAILKEDWERK